MSNHAAGHPGPPPMFEEGETMSLQHPNLGDELAWGVIKGFVWAASIALILVLLMRIFA